MRISFVSSTCYIDFDGWKVIVSRDEGGKKEEKEITQPQMYKILKYFAEHPGRYISKAELIEECWGYKLKEGENVSGYDNTLQPQISNCRKLDEELRAAIETMPGGYCYKGKKLVDDSAVSSVDMTDVRGFCIGDMDHSGCQVRREESSSKTTTAVIDFSLTDSKLCSVVYFTGQRDWSALAADHKLCFKARAVPGPVQAEVEIRLKGRDIPLPVLIQEETNVFEIPMKQFASPESWEEVQEIHFLFHRRAVQARTAVTIESLSLEG